MVTPLPHALAQLSFSLAAGGASAPGPWPPWGVEAACHHRRRASPPSSMPTRTSSFRPRAPALPWLPPAGAEPLRRAGVRVLAKPLFPRRRDKLIILLPPRIRLLRRRILPSAAMPTQVGEILQRRERSILLLVRGCAKGRESKGDGARRPLAQMRLGGERMNEWTRTIESPIRFSCCFLICHP